MFACPPAPQALLRANPQLPLVGRGVSDGSYSSELLPKAKTRTNFLQSEGCPTVLAKRIYYCSAVWRDHPLAQNNLLNLQ